MFCKQRRFSQFPYNKVFEEVTHKANGHKARQADEPGKKSEVVFGAGMGAVKGIKFIYDRYGSKGRQHRQYRAGIDQCPGKADLFLAKYFWKKEKQVNRTDEKSDH